MKKYLVIDESFNDLKHTSAGDQWEAVYDTPEEATAAAESEWSYLTARERKYHHIYSAVVTEADLDDYATDEDTGEIDWRCFTACDTYPGCFDSTREETGE